MKRGSRADVKIERLLLSYLRQGKHGMQSQQKSIINDLKISQLVSDVKEWYGNDGNNAAI